MGSKAKQLNQAFLDAVVSRNLNLARTLLEQGADPRSTDQEHQENAVILAAKFADAAMTRMLLDAGAQVDARDDVGRTALFFAPILSDVFEVLLKAGADVQARDYSGVTILTSKISESATLAEVDRLLELGVDPSLRNDDGESALDMADGLGLMLVGERLRSFTAG